MNSRRRALAWCMLVAIVCAPTVSAQPKALDARGQGSFPNRPVRMVNPYTPGGSVDIVSRAVSAALSETWGQQVIVDNRPGAGTVIGTEIVARAREGCGGGQIQTCAAGAPERLRIVDALAADPTSELRSAR